MCSLLISSFRTDLSNELRVHSIYDLICVLKRETHLKRRICLSFFKCINLVSINLDKLLASFNKYKYWEMLLKVLVVIYFYFYLAISQRNSSTQIVIVNFKDIGNRFIFFLISFWYCIYCYWYCWYTVGLWRNLTNLVYRTSDVHHVAPDPLAWLSQSW